MVGRYAIYDKIASGGMASVHFGRLNGPAGFTRTVAVKRLHPHLMEEADFLTTMLDEARLAARIHHPNVVPTLDVESTDSELLVVMEYVRGESLSRLVQTLTAAGRVIPLPIATAIAVGSLQGLHAAHEATSDQGSPLGIVHRDVSPQNILVGSDGAARIIDFGVAKAAGRLQTTREGVIKGKIPYMAPEQFNGQAVTVRADVFSMSVVLWEMIAGRRLFQAPDQQTLIGRVLAGAKIPPSRYVSNLPGGLDELVMKGLARDPDRRFTSAREMAESLARVVPPAQPPEVGAWVQEVAGESLARRGAVLAEIESSSGSTSASPAAEELVLSSRVVRPRVPFRVRVAAMATVALVLAAAGAAAWIHRGERKTANQLPQTAPSSVTAAPAETAAPSAAPSGVPSTPSAPPIASTPTSPSLQRGPPAAGRLPASTSRPASRNCNPNYTYDSSGQKIFKPECF